MDVSCSICVELGFMTFTTANFGMPTCLQVIERKEKEFHTLFTRVSLHVHLAYTCKLE